MIDIVEMRGPGRPKVPKSEKKVVMSLAIPPATKKKAVRLARAAKSRSVSDYLVNLIDSQPE